MAATKRKIRRAKGTMANRQSDVTMPVVPWDMGADGPANRRGLEVEQATSHEVADANPNAVKRARRVDMLEVWQRNGTITTAGYNAALRLRDAFDNTQRSPGWPDNSKVQSSPKPDQATAIQADRMSDFHAVARHVSGGDWPLLDAVVLRRQAMGYLKEYAGEGHKDGLRHLAAALARLATRLGS